jgi:natural product biosynthesis luciferase-like monooxygenase protein
MVTTSAKFSACLIGSESLLIRCGEFLLSEGHAIRAVGSSTESIREWAERRGIPSFDTRHGFDALGAAPFDYLFSIANLMVLPDGVVRLPKKWAINFHDGPLPVYAGLNTPVWAIVNGEQAHGVTWHLMESKVDAGDILKERSIEIEAGDTALTLNAKCYEAAIESFGDLVGELARGEVVPKKQGAAGRNLYSRRQRPPGACVVAWDRDADAIVAVVRALDFGAYPNPVGLAKTWRGDEVLVLSKARVLPTSSNDGPGTITSIRGNALEVSTATRNVEVHLLSIEGRELSERDLSERFPEGSRFFSPGRVEAAALRRIHESVGLFESYWVDRFGDDQPLRSPYTTKSMEAGEPSFTRMETEIQEDWSEAAAAAFPAIAWADVLVAAFGAFLSRMHGVERLQIGWSDSSLRRMVQGCERFFSLSTPLLVDASPHTPFREFLVQQTEGLNSNRRHMTFMRDLGLRYPTLARQRDTVARFEPAVAVEYWERPDEFGSPVGRDLTFVVAQGGRWCGWIYDSKRISAADVTVMNGRFMTFLQGVVRDGDTRIGELPILSGAEQRQLLETWNDTARPYPRDRCIHELIEAQTDRTPDRVAVLYGADHCTYDELNRRANQLARRLVHEGVGPDQTVGVCLDRSIEMLVAVLAVLKSGGAYLPLDPEYPQDRRRFMLEDSGARLVLTRESLRPTVRSSHARTLCIDAVEKDLAGEEFANIRSGVGSNNLAYVLYTSGSTGKPKGVLIEHRNVVNFFTGMDECINHDPPGVWLAVTSLSFDISVLELFWTLARGFSVVLYTRGDLATPSPSGKAPAGRPVEFSLSYFASDESRSGSDKYRHLREGASFADRNGFAAVWTPERHFHAFGGLFPNPSVISAALATITERIRIRAGSVVLPLHSPIRVVEEWSVVDNLSNGRVDVSFASGWHPNDFVLQPANFASAKQLTFDQVETVRALWRGEAASFPGPDGKPVDVRTLPRPIQPDLPVWITAAGNPETFRVAGSMGANVLTHLLGQSVADLGRKIEIYRAARREAGLDPGTGCVTLMLHTFVGDDPDEVREVVRKPMKDYLRSAIHLVKQAAWSFPTFAHKFDGGDLDRAFDALPADEFEALLEFAFDRYFETSGLFGTPVSCRTRVGELQNLGVDEIACLVDFGVEPDRVLEHLQQLNTLREAVVQEHATVREAVSMHGSVPALIKRHGVTHLQCTPSMAAMLLYAPNGRHALASLETMLVGGEVFPQALALELKTVLSGTLTNMYGPTETTVWSATHVVSEVNGDQIPIGRPVANTQFYVVDQSRSIVPQGVAGELLIGGEGVARGYLNRPDLTAERFVPDTFNPETAAWLYRTGDLVRYRPDGNLEFLGRLDHQVKIRGHRVELQEVEARLDEHPAVRQSVVIAVDDRSGEKCLAAYFLGQDGQEIRPDALRNHLRERLPEFMVPSRFIRLTRFPETANGKIDRQALPSATEAPPMREGDTPSHAASATGPYESTANLELEKAVSQIWRSALEIPKVDRDENFFDLGGHSLLAVRVQQLMKDALATDVKLTDLFAYPTVRTLVAYLGRSREARRNPPLDERGKGRRESIARRRALRQQAHAQLLGLEFTRARKEKKGA